MVKKSFVVLFTLLFAVVLTLPLNSVNDRKSIEQGEMERKYSHKNKAVLQFLKQSGQIIFRGYFF